MEYRLTIDGRLPCLNDFIKECSRHRQNGAKLKKQTEQMIGVFIRQQLRNVEISEPVIMQYLWYEPNKKRDKSNISAFGRKAIEDALQYYGVLKNDNWAYVQGFTDEFYVDALNPRVEVTLKSGLETS